MRIPSLRLKPPDTCHVLVDHLYHSVFVTPQVNVTFSVETAKPGDTVNLVVSAKPNTTIFLLSVDKSVQLLKSGNDITQDTVNTCFVWKFRTCIF